MKINHKLDEQEISKDINDSSFLFSNKNKGFCWLDFSGECFSRYQGVFFSENNKIFRVIEKLKSIDSPEEVNNYSWCVSKKSSEGVETFFMPDNTNSFVYFPCKDYEAEIVLDFKEIYEDNYASYEIEELNEDVKAVVVKMNYNGNDYFLVIRYTGSIFLNKNWIEKEYLYDKNRVSYPFKRSVFNLGKIKSEKIVFSFSKDRNKALGESWNIFVETSEFEKQKKERINFSIKNISNEKVNIAYNSCRILLDNLYINSDNGIFAGLPWFFQYWARDELISLKGFESVNRKGSKEVLEKWIKYIESSSDFLIPSKETMSKEKVGYSVDSLGWIFKRMELFPELMQENRNVLDEFFNSLDSELVESNSISWMDSIERKKGIEIQAMKLFILKLASKMTNKSNFKEIEEELKKKVRENYFDSERGILYDDLEKKIRPNIFIAYYFYPELLTNEEWEKVFSYHIEKLWCDWGGFATVDKTSSEFHNNYSGEKPGSYHNGDSWFWINNLASLCLARVNRKKFYSQIRDILNASTEEILFSGCIGNHSELSSASLMKSEGAVSQAFSAGFYIEMVEGLREI